MAKISYISLGCPKNQVDFERILAKLTAAGHKIYEYRDHCDIAIVNTCAFIEDAKKEALDCIYEMVDMKENAQIQKIIVTGCLAERYQKEIMEEIPEVDAVCGLGANDDIVSVVEELLDGKEKKVKSFPDKYLLPENGDRFLLSPDYSAYLKIAEGCSNCCTYCIIPKIRGSFRSRPLEEIAEEAKTLASRGVKELILVAQDTTMYGQDLYGEKALPKLIRELAKIEGIAWIRLLYAYPNRITPELIDLMKEEPKFLHYLDLPIQHVNPRILKAMGRSGDKESLLRLISTLREEIPDLTLRTSLIAGFPGETEEEFEELAEFVKEVQFDYLGCFAYSREEDTPAYDLENQIDEEVKTNRAEIINEMQREIVEQRAEKKIGTIQTVLTEGYDIYTDSYIGRTTADAPEIDRIIRFTSKSVLEDGDIVSVKVQYTEDGDLFGCAVN